MKVYTENYIIKFTLCYTLSLLCRKSYHLDFVTLPFMGESSECLYGAI